MRKKALSVVFSLFFGLVFIQSFAQTPLAKFAIPESGIYKITSSQARQLGFSGLNEVAIFGYPGMLPQILDSTQLKLQEIAAWQDGDNLYFYLEGPNSVQFSEQGEIIYDHHLFSDSLKYLIGRKQSPKRIQESTGNNQTADSNPIWYSFRNFKEEKTNLINSGRSWFSDPIRPGQSLNVNFGITAGNNSPWLLAASLVSQSTTEAQIRILAGNDLLTEIPFNPIPNTTYGIKGREEAVQLEFTPPERRLGQVRFTFQGSGAGYLDYVSVGIPFQNGGLSEGIYLGQKEGLIQLSSQWKTWEVSDFFHPIAYVSGNSASGKKWVIFNPSQAKTINAIQQLAATMDTSTFPELLIITHPQFSPLASKLKQHKTRLGVSTEVITTSQIFDSFGYGNPDLVAIRNFIASQYHTGNRLKHVLFLGKGTFDYKRKLGGRPNLIPIYTSRNSLDPLRSFSSDDFYGLIVWGQGNWEETREGDESQLIGIGRVPAITFEEANTWAEKLIKYETSGFTLPTYPTINFLADDGDNSIHMRDAEVHADFLEENHPYFRTEKLYLDRFEQERQGTRQSSPQMREALEETLDQGTLILNYIGHGNETTLTAEEVFRVQDITDWGSQDQLALWMTATCEFGRHDSPFIRSAAEELLFAKSKGAISLLTTGRPVFSSVNFSLNQAFIEEVLRLENNTLQSIGDIFKNTKNQSLNGPLNRNFSLLGDPSMKLAIPELEVRIGKIFDSESELEIDSLRPSHQVFLEGEVIDPVTKAMLPSFNGKFQLELRDKANPIKTLGDENSPFEFEEENRILFKGEGEVKNGKFSAQLKIPADLNEAFAKGNLRITAWDSLSRKQASGFQKLILGGPKKSSTDQTGPEIEVRLADNSPSPFIIATRQVELIADFLDQSGIYISNKNPDQILRLKINQDPDLRINELYQSIGGGFQKGQAKILLKGLMEGTNHILISAWDNVGNLSEFQFTIEVRDSRKPQILEHKVYPNPASEKTSFFIRHNRPGENLVMTLEVYSLLGKTLFSDSRRLVKAEEVIDDWHWIFFQSMTKYPAKGTYIYKLTLISETDSAPASASGKLLIQ